MTIFYKFEKEDNIYNLFYDLLKYSIYHRKLSAAIVYRYLHHLSLDGESLHLSIAGWKENEENYIMMTNGDIHELYYLKFDGFQY